MNRRALFQCCKRRVQCRGCRCIWDVKLNGTSRLIPQLCVFFQVGGVFGSFGLLVLSHHSSISAWFCQINWVVFCLVWLWSYIWQWCGKQWRGFRLIRELIWWMCCTPKLWIELLSLLFGVLIWQTERDFSELSGGVLIGDSWRSCGSCVVLRLLPLKAFNRPIDWLYMVVARVMLWNSDITINALKGIRF